MNTSVKKAIRKVSIVSMALISVLSLAFGSTQGIVTAAEGKVLSYGAVETQSAITTADLYTRVKGAQPIRYLSNNDPNAVGIDKKIVEFDPATGISKVQLAVTGKQAVSYGKPAYVVLAIDKSASMDKKKLDAAKIGAKRFVDTLLKGSNKVAVIAFDSENTDLLYKNLGTSWANATQIDSVKAAIDGIKSSGTTCGMLALEGARDLLALMPNDGEKVIVFLSDGEMNKNSPNSAAYTGATPSDKTIYLAKTLANTTLYTIGLELAKSSKGRETLKAMASSDNCYFDLDAATAAASQLYERIAEEIIAIAKASVVDVLSDAVELVRIVGNNATAIGNIITWNVPSAIDPKIATLEYYVRPKAGYVGKINISDSTELTYFISNNTRQFVQVFPQTYVYASYLSLDFNTSGDDNTTECYVTLKSQKSGMSTPLIINDVISKYDTVSYPLYASSTADTYTISITEQPIPGQPVYTISPASASVKFGDKNDGGVDVTISSPKSTTVNSYGANLTKEADKKVISSGDTVTYTITVKNTGTGALTESVVTDNFFPRADNLRVFMDGVKYTNFKVDYDKLSLGTIPAGATVQIKYEVLLENATGGNVEIVNKASFDSKELKSPPKGDVIVGVNPGDQFATIKKESNKKEVNSGDTVGYTITIKNTGTEALTKLTLKDPAFSKATNIKYGINPGTYYNVPNKAIVTDTITFDSIDDKAFTLPIGATLVVTYDVVLKNNGQNAVNFENYAELKAKESTTSVNNSSTVKVKPSGDSDGGIGGGDDSGNSKVKITKKANKTVVEAGSDVTFTLTIENKSNMAVTDLVVSDTYFSEAFDIQYKPDGETSYKNIPPGAVIDNKIDMYDLDSRFTLEPGKTLLIQYKIKVENDSSSKTTLKNSAGFDGKSGDSSLNVTGASDITISVLPSGEKSPGTGDSSMSMLWLAISAFSFIACVSVVVIRSKTKRRTHY